MTASIAELWRYPVKSMQGEQRSELELVVGGVVGDRAYALVDEETGRVASAKHPRKWATLLHCSARFDGEPAAGSPPPPVVITLPDGSVVRSDDEGVDDRLSAFVGRRVRLTAGAPPHATFEEQWPAVEGMAPEELISSTTVEVEDGDPVSALDLAMLAPAGSLVDLSPVHLLTTATLRRLAAVRPGTAFEPRRYRPNAVLEVDGEGFVENEWTGREVRLGAAAAVVRLPTMRCVMTTLAQPGLDRDLEVLRAAAAHNRIEIPGLGTWACTGAYADVTTAGVVTVDDPVELS